MLTPLLIVDAAPLGPLSLEQAAADTAARGLADVLVITGSGTGQPTDPAAVQRARRAAPGVPVWVGSGLTPDTAPAFGDLDGAIVGTWLHEDADLSRPLDPERVRAMRAALR